MTILMRFALHFKVYSIREHLALMYTCVVYITILCSKLYSVDGHVFILLVFCQRWQFTALPETDHIVTMKLLVVYMSNTSMP